jgi:hypothetical protein
MLRKKLFELQLFNILKNDLNRKESTLDYYNKFFFKKGQKNKYLVSYFYSRNVINRLLYLGYKKYIQIFFPFNIQYKINNTRKRNIFNSLYIYNYIKDFQGINLFFNINFLNKFCVEILKDDWEFFNETKNIIREESSKTYSNFIKSLFIINYRIFNRKVYYNSFNEFFSDMQIIIEKGPLRYNFSGFIWILLYYFLYNICLFIYFNLINIITGLLIIFKSKY